MDGHWAIYAFLQMSWAACATLFVRFAGVKFMECNWLYELKMRCSPSCCIAASMSYAAYSLGGRQHLRCPLLGPMSKSTCAPIMRRHFFMPKHARATREGAPSRTNQTTSKTIIIIICFCNRECRALSCLPRSVRSRVHLKPPRTYVLMLVSTFTRKITL